MSSGFESEGKALLRGQPRCRVAQLYGIGHVRPKAFYVVTRAKWEIRFQRFALSFRLSPSLPVNEWVQKDDSPADWTIPLTERPRASSTATEGTKISVNRLHREVEERLKTGTVE